MNNRAADRLAAHSLRTHAADETHAPVTKQRGSGHDDGTARTRVARFSGCWTSACQSIQASFGLR